MNKRFKKNVLAGGFALALGVIVAVGCGKEDKKDIFGGWEIDLKGAKGLTVESAVETIHFNSDANMTYSESHEVRERPGGNWDRWEIKGNYERKNNKITLSNRVKKSGEQMPSVTYKYRIDGDKLIFIVKDEGYKNDEKIYTKIKKTVE